MPISFENQDGVTIINSNSKPEESKSSDQINSALKDFLLAKSQTNLRFAHLMFWCILSSMDDTQSIQMSQHKNKETWDVLKHLISSHDTHDNSVEYREDEFFKSFINLPKKDVADGSVSDTGGSSFNYGHVEKLESHARMVRFDQ